MQPKVSMAMPCYNKAEYIGEMFDSIIAQKWDNIELILVNDGSTDGTRDIISDYIPKFKARGFEVIVIDQENAGVCAAAKAGLERVTGDYVCMVDADDELAPAYVGTMAGWLCEHPDYDYATCGAMKYTGSKERKDFSPTGYTVAESCSPKITELYLLSKVCEAVWAYMVRREYLEKCRIAENYDTATRGSHEPSFLIPLMAHGGKFKAFSEPLYHFNFTPPVTHSRPADRARVYNNLQGYYGLCRKAIASLPGSVADARRKARLTFTAHTRFLGHTISYYRSKDDDNARIVLPSGSFVGLLGDYLNALNAYFSKVEPVRGVSEKDIPYLLLAVEAAILKKKVDFSPPRGRVIAWGALGRRARRVLPKLKGTDIEPTTLWDMDGDGGDVEKPDPGSLSPDDLVLVLPAKGSEVICGGLKSTGCHIMAYQGILDALAFIKYPQHYCADLP